VPYGKSVKFSHIRFRALGPDVIPVYSQSQPTGD